ncbi:MAG: hypothetical protein ACYC6T_08140 [Thermoleophilia bacterium]
MNSSDDLLAFLRDLLQTRYRLHLADGLRDADARREALLDLEEWTRALDDGAIEFVEWIPAAEVDPQPPVEVQRMVNPTQMSLI